MKVIQIFLLCFVLLINCVFMVSISIACFEQLPESLILLPIPFILTLTAFLLLDIIRNADLWLT